MPDGVDIHLVKKMNLDPVRHPLWKKKIYSKWIEDLNVKSEIVNISEENIGEDMIKGIGKMSFNRT